MAEEKEQLKISAELDTSKLKQQAKQGLNEVVNETKRVQNQVKQTSSTIDSMGSSLNKASQQGMHAMRQVGNEAERTARKIDDIARTTRNINLGQMASTISQIVNSPLAATLGGRAGQALGMSAESMTYAGEGIKGGAMGAQIGARFGGWGMLIGTLAGVASGLLGASDKLDEAAARQKEAAEKELEVQREILQKQVEDYRHSETLENDRKMYDNWKTYISSLDRDKLPEGEAILQKNRRSLQAAIDATKADIESQIKLGETDPKTANEKLVELRKRLSRLQEGTRWYDDVQKLFDTRRNDFRNKDIKSTESLLGIVEKEGQTRLSDSLTRVGGGAGYGTQMQSVASRVSTISKDIKAILDVLRNPTQSDFNMGVF